MKSFEIWQVTICVRDRLTIRQVRHSHISADKHSCCISTSLQWRMDPSDAPPLAYSRGAPGTHSRPNFFSFSCSFWGKLGRVIGWRLSFTVGTPSGKS